MHWLEHSEFSPEFKKLSKKHPTITTGFGALKLLLEKQFDPNKPVEVIGPGKIHRIHQNATWSLWKVEVSVPGSGLRPSQWPRLWFAISGSSVAFLTIDMHGNNYSDSDLMLKALNRATDIF